MPVDLTEYTPDYQIIGNDYPRRWLSPAIPMMPHTVEFDGYARPETAQMAAIIALKGQSGVFER